MYNMCITIVIDDIFVIPRKTIEVKYKQHSSNTDNSLRE